MKHSKTNSLTNWLVVRLSGQPLPHQTTPVRNAAVDLAPYSKDEVPSSSGTRIHAISNAAKKRNMAKVQRTDLSFGGSGSSPLTVSGTHRTSRAEIWANSRAFSNSLMSVNVSQRCRCSVTRLPIQRPIPWAVFFVALSAKSVAEYSFLKAAESGPSSSSVCSISIVWITDAAWPVAI